MLFGIIMGICALMMFGIGVFQITRASPVSFYTGEKAPDAEAVRDLRAWNRKHGAMWIVYGLVIVSGIIAGMIVNSDTAFIAIECACLLIPPPLMTLCHRKLARDYIKS